MNQPTGSKILAFGHYQPSQVVTNEDLSKVIETNDAWIRDRVGIAARRVAGTARASPTWRPPPPGRPSRPPGSPPPTSTR